MRFLNLDHGFYRMLSRLTDIVWLNILTLLCCIPVFTAGASISAMYYVLLKMTKNEEGYLTKNFFKAFRENFKNATILWLIVCALAAFFLLELALLRAGSFMQGGKIAAVIWAAVLLVAAIIYMGVLYSFPLLARYDNGVRVTLRNAYLFVFAYLPRSLAMTLVSLLPAALVVLSPYFLFFWLLIGLSLPASFCSRLLMKSFEDAEKIQKKTADKTEMSAQQEQRTEL